MLLSERRSAKVSDRMSDIASSLQSISQYLENLSVKHIHEDAIFDSSFEKRALKIYNNRKYRAKIFDNESIFGEPAWDILLDLFVAEERNKKISVSSACIGANVPITTAHRWLNLLEAEGFLIREYDDQDARRCYIKISAKTCAMMRSYLSM